MPLVTRLLPTRVADGAWNMAADDALLETAVGGRASLRFYGWSAPTLSLGYFQPHAPARGHGRLGQLAWVRRPTGGAAIVHHLELTYALAMPPGHEWQPRGSSWLVRMHELIRDALADLGVKGELCVEEQKLGEVLCFLHYTPGDLIVATSKVVGSAQRKHRGALLQHGSILLKQSPWTPELPGIAELSGRSLTAEQVQSALIDRLSRGGWKIEPDDWTAEELTSIPERLALRYQAPTWNEKR